jgi:PiT family inorganic phosphate transporter
MHWEELLRFGTFPFTELSAATWLLILLALVFDFLNGFHDAANSVATVVSTRVLTPQVAVIWAAIFNFVAFLVFPLGVANTIAKDIVDQSILDNRVIAATLVAACGWNLLTWYLALPTSSSHALIGGMIGAALMKTLAYGTPSWQSVYKWDGILKTVGFIVVSPMLGMVFGLTTAIAVGWLFRRATPRRVDRVFRWGQLFSAGFFSLNHGGNDAQKTMGIIFALIAFNATPAAQAAQTAGTVLRPIEVVLACHLAIALGTMFGGWRIVKTMGQRIIRLRPVDGFCAENGAGLAVTFSTLLGTPVSTTHAITFSIVGVGAVKRLSAVRWGVAGRVVWAWVLTIPGAMFLALLSWALLWALGLFA